METFHSREKEQNPEKRALVYLFKTIGQEPSDLRSFPQLLFREIEGLEKFQEVLDAIKDLEGKELIFGLFESLKRGNDNKELIGNGVLIDSMRSGKLECSGRTMIASRALNKMGVDHSIAAPYGHSMLLLELDEDTLVYFDANNDLLFSFPKEALTGYAGIGQFAECELQDFQKREKDFFDGKNSVMRKMMVLSPRAGILNSYLNNVGAALGGAPEFREDKIQTDQEASEKIDAMKTVLLGEQKVAETFYEEGQIRQKKEEEERAHLFNEVRRLYAEAGSKDLFFEQMKKNGLLWKRWPYLQTNEEKEMVLELWYERLNEENV